MLNILWRNSVIQVFFWILIVAMLGGLGVYFLELRAGTLQFSSIWEALWWSVVTMTTVGYGDYTPQGSTGRLLAVIIMFTGISLISFLTASIASISVTRKMRASQGLMPFKVKNHIVICGRHHKIEPLIDALMSIDPDGKDSVIVLVNEESEDKMQAVKNQYGYAHIKYIRGEFTSEQILKRANIETARAAIIFPTEQPTGGASDDKTILATLTIKNLNSHVQVVAYVHDRANIAHLRKANADNIVLADNFGSFIIASHILNPGIPQFANELLSASSERHFQRAPIPQDFVGKTFGELSQHNRQKKGWLTLGLYAEEEQQGIGSFLSADTSQLDAFIERKLREAGHSLSEGSHTTVNINPPDDHVIHIGEGVLIIP